MAATRSGAGRSRLEPDSAPLRGDTPKSLDFCDAALFECNSEMALLLQF